MESNLEQQVGGSINEVFLHLEDWEFDDLARGLRAIVERFRWLADSDPAAFREIERRVAEDVLIIAQDKERPVEACEQLLAQVLALGWSDRYRAAEVLLPFARYCTEHGRSDLVRLYLKPVLRDLESRPPDPADDELHANLLSAVRGSLGG
jgi:hypothetical protein